MRLSPDNRLILSVSNNSEQWVPLVIFGQTFVYAFIKERSLHDNDGLVVLQDNNIRIQVRRGCRLKSKLKMSRDTVGWSCHGDNLASSVLEDHDFAIRHFSSIKASYIRRIQRVQLNLHRTHQHPRGD